MVLFIIEVSMISNAILISIHLYLSEIFFTNDGSAKKHILVLGESLQIPPVREKSPLEKLSNAEVNKFLESLNMANLRAEQFTYDDLTQNVRQFHDFIFVRML